MRILRRMAEKKPEMLQDCLPAALKQTAAFHERLRSNYHASSSASTAGEHPTWVGSGLTKPYRISGWSNPTQRSPVQVTPAYHIKLTQFNPIKASQLWPM